MFGGSYYTSESVTQSTSTSYSGESSGYDFSFGYFIQQYTLVTVTHSESESEYTGITLAYKSIANNISITTVLLQNDGSAIALSASHTVQDDSDGDEFKYSNIAVDYYFNPRLGVGGFISNTNSNRNINDIATKGINLSYFINQDINLSAEYSRTEADSTEGKDAGLGSKSVAVQATIYF